jgi:adenylate cyclase
MPPWEAAQLVLGLAIPPLLIAHVVGTRFTWTLLGHNIDYERVVGALWSTDWGIARQSLLLIVVWAHVCAGLHYWLRVREWYRTAEPLAFAVALLLPAIALAGFASAGFYLWPSIESVGGMQKYNVELAGMSDAERMRMAAGAPASSTASGSCSRARCSRAGCARASAPPTRCATPPAA